MAKRTRTDKKPIHVVAPLDDVLDRFAGLARTGGRDAAEMPAVTLIEDEGTGDRLLVYVGPNGTDLEIQTVGDEPWFTQKQLAQMFGVDVRTINDHIGKFLADGELGDSVIRDFRITATDGKPYTVKHYTLDVAFYVGYRVNSAQGVLFRKWATQVLVAFATKGFVIHKRRLKDPENFDRIRELRDSINEIRASDVPLYAELRRICSLCQDYDPKSQAARDFFAHMRAKLYWAVTSNTPSMLLRDRADATQTNMGMLSWKKDRPLQDDATSPQSYLAEVEGRELSNLTVILLDVVSDQLDLGRLTLMSEASELVDRQLGLLNRPILTHGGRVSSDDAEAHAKAEYEKFDAARKATRIAAAARELQELKQTGAKLPSASRKSRAQKRD